MRGRAQNCRTTAVAGVAILNPGVSSTVHDQIVGHNVFRLLLRLGVLLLICRSCSTSFVIFVIISIAIVFMISVVSIIVFMLIVLLVIVFFAFSVVFGAAMSGNT